MHRILTPAIVLLLASTVLAGEKEPLPLRVNRSIDLGAASLVRRQAEDGSWKKDDKVHPLGRTALCVFTLLHAGYPKSHPAVRKGLGSLGLSLGYGSVIKPHSTYEAACLVLMLNALGKKAASQPIRHICQWLVDNFRYDVGLWGYPDGRPDLSNTQYAALALKAGERHGFHAPDRLWKRLVSGVLALRSPTGGFRYRGDSIYRATMTHAGLLVLLFAEEALGPKAPKKHIRPAMEEGHKWCLENYSVELNPDGRGWRKGQYFYYMYGLERYSVFFGIEKYREHDWYREGAEVLLELQKKNGEWGNLAETCFAILFLRRATLTVPEERIGGGVAQGEWMPDDPPRRLRPAKEVPFLREWLVAGPFPGVKKEDDHFFVDHVGAKRAKPVVGGRAGKKKWETYKSPEDKIDFKHTVGSHAWSSFYAATWLYAGQETEALLWLQSDDGIRAHLNGEEVLVGHHHNASDADFYRVPVNLKKGRNLLLLHVENLAHYVWFKARLSNTERQPLAGVLSSTSPQSR